jgi:hypothetical protein
MPLVGVVMLTRFYQVWGHNEADGWGVIGECSLMRDAINLKHELKDDYSQFKIVERNIENV